MKIVLVSLLSLFILSCGRQEGSKIVYNNSIPEGKVINTHWVTEKDYIVTIQNDSVIQKVLVDEGLRWSIVNGVQIKHK